VKDILTQPPSRQELAGFAKRTPGGVKEMVTKNAQMPDYQQHLAGKQLTDEQLLDLLAKVPNLLRKPLLTDGERVIQGVDDPAKLAAFVRG
jgi:arsenate reductase-like glutaredoxin family protein